MHFVCLERTRDFHFMFCGRFFLALVCFLALVYFFTRVCFFWLVRFFVTCMFFRTCLFFRACMFFSRLYVFFALVCFFALVLQYLFSRGYVFHTCIFFSRAYSSCLCFLECPYVFFGCDYAYGLCNWNCACFRVTSQDMRGYHSHCIREAPFPHPL